MEEGIKVTRITWKRCENPNRMYFGGSELFEMYGSKADWVPVLKEKNKGIEGWAKAGDLARTILPPFPYENQNNDTKDNIMRAIEILGHKIHSDIGPPRD